MKEKLINEITLIDTANFRKKGLLENGKYKHEPPLFRQNLYKIYNHLNESELEKLLILKKL